MSEKREFKGVWIPKHIWLNPTLSPIEKLFLAEIDSLDNDDEKGCFASNEYFGNFFGISEGSAANIISSLRKRGYVVQTFFDGRNRGISLHENVKAGFMPDGTSLHENVKAGFTKRGKQVSRKREHTNIVDNKDYNKEENNAGASAPLSSSPENENQTLEANPEKKHLQGGAAGENSLAPPFTPVGTIEPQPATIVKLYDNQLPGVTIVDSIPPQPMTSPEKTGREQQKREQKEKEIGLATRVISYLNEKAGRSFRVNADANAKGIIARARDGFTEDEMRTVIDFKVAEWGKDAKFYQYLTPETLFRPSHFENYLQAATAAKPKPAQTQAPKPMQQPQNGAYFEPSQYKKFGK